MGEGDEEWIGNVRLFFGFKRPSGFREELCALVHWYDS